MFLPHISGISFGRPDQKFQSLILKKSVDTALNRNRRSARLHAGPGCCHSPTQTVAQKRAYPKTTAV